MPPEMRDTSRIPPQAPGECRHLYLTGDATCVHCGMKFDLAWTAERESLVPSSNRNLLIAAGFGVLLGVSYFMGLALPAYLFLIGTVLFFTRGILGKWEMYQRHGFVPGKLGPLVKRPPVNVLLPKPYLTTVGIVRFPIDKETHDQFREGETLLVEHLRWSRLPVAIYRGRMS